METEKLTTYDLLKLEDAGGILSDAIAPNGILPSDLLHVWVERFPLVDHQLITKWYAVYKAKIELQEEMARIFASAWVAATKGKRTHKNLGEVFITEDCLALQLQNADPTSIFVEHAGEIKEVSRTMLD